ncbi:MAG: DUF6119 family protein ['Conium maculatum' witches'-broom phytoplasma]|nr:DUF6119 family protein ['Conium maculatum' witches'-broom phytoplasma]
MMVKKEKSNEFNMYLLKQNYTVDTDNTEYTMEKLLIDKNNETNFLYSETKWYKHAIAINEPNMALYSRSTQAKEPFWAKYFGIKKEYRNRIKNEIALFFVKVGKTERIFVLTFSYAYHYLPKESYEIDFGQKISFLCLDDKKLKSSKVVSAKKKHHKNINLSEHSSLDSLEIDEEDYYDFPPVLKGFVKPEYEGLYSRITGQAGLNFFSPVKPNGIMDLCEKLLEIYNKKDTDKTQTTFQRLNTHKVIKNTKEIKKLNIELFQEMQNNWSSFIKKGSFPEEESKIHVTTFFLNDNWYLYAFNKIYFKKDLYQSPFVIDLTNSAIHDNFWREFLRYLEKNKDQNKHIIGFLENTPLEENNIEKILTYFKKYKIILTNETETSEKQIEKTVWETLLFQCDIGNSEKSFYYLYNGVWYNYDNNFIQRLNKNLRKKQIDEATFPVFFKKQDLTETQYNKETTKHLNANSTNSSLYFNLDTKTVSIKQDINNRSSFEPCDILEIKCLKEHVFLYFVKVDTSTQKFSHLCRQGVNSAYFFTDFSRRKKSYQKIIISQRFQRFIRKT